MIHTFSFPTSIFFGVGARNKLAETLKEFKIQRPLLVGDLGVAALPCYKECNSSLSSAGFSVTPYYDFVGNPFEKHVTAGVASYKKNNCDGIVVIGGGAPMDVAKCIGLMATHSGNLFDYDDDLNGGARIGALPPIVAIPTTAGTGSEVGRCAVISNEEDHRKVLICSPHFLPRRVLADPELLVGLPAKVTAATGMDALTHLVEAFLAKAYHPVCDGIALEGVRLIHQGALNLSVKEPGNLKGRSDMLLASMMGAMAFQKGLGLTHSLAHALSSVKDTHHGLANALCLVAVLKYNQHEVPEKLNRLAHTCGFKTGDEFIVWVKKLTQDIGLPQSLREVGVSKEDLPKLRDFALKDFCLSSNPRPAGAEQIAKLYEEIF